MKKHTLRAIDIVADGKTLYSTKPNSTISSFNSLVVFDKADNPGWLRGDTEVSDINFGSRIAYIKARQVMTNKQIDLRVYHTEGFYWFVDSSHYPSLWKVDISTMNRILNEAEINYNHHKKIYDECVDAMNFINSNDLEFSK